MAEYVSKNEVRPYKALFATVIEKVRKDVKKEGITFTYNLVGSAKRNLVVRHHNKGFDCDYQIIIQKNKNALSENELRTLFANEINAHKPVGFKNCENSTSSLTMKKVNTEESKIEFSYDIVLLRLYNDQVQIIRQDKDNPQEGYFWNSLPDMQDLDGGLKQIHGAQMWRMLRDVYRKKKTEKNEQGKHKDKKSFQLLHEAVNETLKNYGK